MIVKIWWYITEREKDLFECVEEQAKLYLKAEFILNEKFWSHYLSLASPFTWPTPPGPYRATICRGRKKLWITYFFWPHKDMEGLPGWVISPMPGPPPRQHKHERQDTRSTHSVIPTRRIWNDDLLWPWGPWGPKVSWHLSDRWRKPRKNLTQETCPDRGSNPGPLRDKRVCYHLLHSGGLQ